MKVISKNEGKQWLAENNFVLENDSVYMRSGADKLIFALPDDSASKTILAQVIVKFIRERNVEGFFWISEYGIWPSCENMKLFDGYRKGMGELRPVWEAPFHLFNGEDLSDLECLLGISFYFYWGGIISLSDKEVIIRFNHDEFIEFEFNQKKSHDYFFDALSELEFKEFKEK
jgi:hypothetical protein